MAAPTSYTYTSDALPQPAPQPAVRESYDLFARGWGGYAVGPFGYAPRPWYTATGTGQDRKGGRQLPLFWNEIDLRGFRLVARDLDSRNQYAIGFLNNLVNYCVHKGYGWQASPRGVKKAPYATGYVSSEQRALLAYINARPHDYTAQLAYADLIEEAGYGRRAEVVRRNARQGGRWLKEFAQPGDDGRADLVAKAQRILDAWRDANRWPSRSREAFRRWRRDGEVFGRFFPGGWDRLPQFRFIDPELVGSPTGDTDGPDSFGIRTDEEDVCEVVAFHLLAPDGRPGEWLDADRVVYAKANTDTGVKRGVGDFLPLAEDLDYCRKILRSMLVSAQRQASKAWVEKYPGATAVQVAGMVPVRPGDTRQFNSRNEYDPFDYYRGYGYDPTLREPDGSIMRVEGDREFMPTPGASVSGYVEAVQAALRGACVRWNLPEFATSDASNNNFASALVANSPFVRAVEGEQYEYGSQWERPVALKVLELAAEAGMLTPAELRKLDVEVTEPQVASAEPEKDASIDQIYHAMGVKSATTIQLSRGLDPQHEQANFDAEKKRGMVPGDEPPPEPGGQQQDEQQPAGESSRLDGRAGDPADAEDGNAALLAALRREGTGDLVQRDVTYHRGGQTFTRKQWVSADDGGPSDQKPAAAEDDPSSPRVPKTPEEAHALGAALRGGLDAVTGTPVAKCVVAAAALVQAVPGAQAYYGVLQTPVGKDDHVVVKVGDYYLDVTADQYEAGSAKVRVFTDLPPEYGGFKKVDPHSLMDSSERGEADQVAGRLAGRKKDEGRAREVKDASGHEHGDDGKFSGAGGGHRGTLADGSAVHFVPHPSAVPGEHETVLVDAAALDSAWSKDEGYYVPPGGGGAEVPGRRERFGRFLKTGRPVESPKAVMVGDAVAVDDGRHRLSFLRDAGIDRVAVTVPAEQADEFRRRFASRAREDRAGLVKKKVQGKDGKQHTVYVRPDRDAPADKTGKAAGDSRPHPADSDPPKADSLDLSGVHDDPGVVAKVKEKVGKILTALARRAYDAALMSPQIIDAAGLLVDTPEDMKKIGYNPATAGADAQKTGNVLQDAGIPLTPYQFVNLCTTVLPGVVGWVKGKLGGGSAAESDDIDALAELLHGLLAGLAEEFGFAAPPDAAAIAANLRAL